MHLNNVAEVVSFILIIILTSIGSYLFGKVSANVKFLTVIARLNAEEERKTLDKRIDYMIALNDVLNRMY